MKKLAMVVLIAILLTASQDLTARGGGGGGMGGSGGSGGMGSDGTGGMGSGGMGSSGAQGSAGQGKMMQGRSMNEAAPMMQQMNDMTNRMSSVMKGGMNQDTRTKMSQFMRDMSKEIGEMSRMMERGKVSDKDVQKMQDRLADMQKRLEGIQGK